MFFEGYLFLFMKDIDTIDYMLMNLASDVSTKLGQKPIRCRQCKIVQPCSQVQNTSMMSIDSVSNVETFTF